MPIFEFNKLVRDKIVEKQETSGAVPKWRILTVEERLSRLVRKVIEEVEEIPFDDQVSAIEELADVREALDSLGRALGIDRAEVDLVQRDKALTSGSFDRGVFIEEVEIEENDPWTEELRERGYTEK